MGGIGVMIPIFGREYWFGAGGSGGAYHCQCAMANKGGAGGAPNSHGGYSSPLRCRGDNSSLFPAEAARQYLDGGNAARNSGAGGSGGAHSYWYDAGDGGSGIVVMRIRRGPDVSALRPRSAGTWYEPWGMYTAESVSIDDAKWYDVSGNNRHADIANTATFSCLSGQRSRVHPICGLYGSTSTSVTWPVWSIPVDFTICTISRYSGGNQKRIFDASGENWLHGHWNGHRGVAHYRAWITSSSTPNPPNIGTYDWVLMCTQNGADRLVYVNGYNVWNGQTTPFNQRNGGYRLTINNGNQGNEHSDFGVAEVIIWDRALARDEFLDVHNRLFAYLGGSIEGKAAHMSWYYPGTAIVPQPEAGGIVIAPGVTMPSHMGATSGRCYNSRDTCVRFRDPRVMYQITFETTQVVDYLLVGGGGEGGGGSYGGGGGGGGVVHRQNVEMQPGTYPIRVGAGGGSLLPRQWRPPFEPIVWIPFDDGTLTNYGSRRDTVKPWQYHDGWYTDYVRSPTKQGLAWYDYMLMVPDLDFPAMYDTNGGYTICAWAKFRDGTGGTVWKMDPDFGTYPKLDYSGVADWAFYCEQHHKSDGWYVIFKDGVQQSATNGVTHASGNGPLLIYMHGRASGDDKNYLDDFLVYDKVLSDERIAQLFQAFPRRAELTPESGQPSSFNNVEALGGGAGGYNGNGQAGASSGGGSPTFAAGTYVASQGNSGANAWVNENGGGGGGAGGPGLYSQAGQGGGGPGRAVNIDGVPAYYGGGGAGGHGGGFEAPSSLGGIGGGGASASRSNGGNSVDGAPNTGGGGGAEFGDHEHGTRVGGGGGDGVVVLRIHHSPQTEAVHQGAYLPTTRGEDPTVVSGVHVDALDHEFETGQDGDDVWLMLKETRSYRLQFDRAMEVDVLVVGGGGAGGLRAGGGGGGGAVVHAVGCVVPSGEYTARVGDGGGVNLLSYIDMKISAFNLASMTIPAWGGGEYHANFLTYQSGVEQLPGRTVYIVEWFTTARLDMVLCAGGGGGGGRDGYDAGGGGGAGEVLLLENYDIPKGRYYVTVGRGGNGQSVITEGAESGYDTEIYDADWNIVLHVKGGGRGGYGERFSGYSFPAEDGGSGGGGGRGNGVFGKSIKYNADGYGHDGDAGISTTAGSGGGAAGAPSSSNHVDNGPAGVTLLGTTYASGGAGGWQYSQKFDSGVYGAGGGGAQAQANPSGFGAGQNGAAGAIYIRYKPIQHGAVGETSAVFDLLALGGGGGGSDCDNPRPPVSGGSGGGDHPCAGASTAGGAAKPNPVIPVGSPCSGAQVNVYGNAGAPGKGVGTGAAGGAGGGGGGGAGEAGHPEDSSGYPDYGGNGGDGIAINITGKDIFFGGGGGGTCYSFGEDNGYCVPGAGGKGGGGGAMGYCSGSNCFVPSGVGGGGGIHNGSRPCPHVMQYCQSTGNGGKNTGGGGGSGHHNWGGGGAGGSGIVIIRFKGFADQTDIVKCPANFFAPKLDLTKCLPCPPGSTSSAGATECTRSVAALTTSVSPMVCSAGYYNYDPVHFGTTAGVTTGEIASTNDMWATFDGHSSQDKDAEYTFSLDAPLAVELVLVGGGGSGGARSGGGGGGDVLILSSREHDNPNVRGPTQTLPAGKYRVTVGAGGRATPNVDYTPGFNGQTTSIIGIDGDALGFELYAAGGGRGGSCVSGCIQAAGNPNLARERLCVSSLTAPTSCGGDGGDYDVAEYGGGSVNGFLSGAGGAGWRDAPHDATGKSGKSMSKSVITLCES